MLRVGIVGLGVIGKVHLDILLNNKENVVTLCDIDLSKVKKLKEKYNLKCSLYTSYLEMIEKENLDVIHICTPHYLHFDMVINSLRNNINCLVEKPLCISLVELENILKEEQKSKAKLGVCFQNRYNESVIFLKEYLKNKKIINANAILFWSRDLTYYNQGCWRKYYKTSGGGVLFTQAIHTIDLMIYLCGYPNSLKARCLNNLTDKGIEVEDSAFITSKGKANFNIYSTILSKKDFPIYISIKTEDEYILLFNNEVFINGIKVDLNKNTSYFGKECYGHGHDSLIKNFYNSIMNNVKFEIDGNEASKSIKFILASYKSNNKEIILK